MSPSSRPSWNAANHQPGRLGLRHWRRRTDSRPHAVRALSLRTTATARTKILLALGALTTAAFVATPGPYGLLIAVSAGADMVRGNLTLFQATAITDRWGTTHYGRPSGLLAAPATTAVALAPFPGALAVPLGGYGPLFFLLATVSVAAAITAPWTTTGAVRRPIPAALTTAAPPAATDEPALVAVSNPVTTRGFSGRTLQESTNSRASDRAISKIRCDESGHAGSERRLIALGARPRAAREPGRAWLEEALAAVGATLLEHRGNHRYAHVIGPRRDRRPLTATAYPYPKKDGERAA